MQKVLNGNTGGMLLPYKTWLFTSWKGTIYTEDKREENKNCFAKTRHSSHLHLTQRISTHYGVTSCIKETSQRHSGIPAWWVYPATHHAINIVAQGFRQECDEWQVFNKNFLFHYISYLSNFGWLLTVFYLIKVDFG